MKLSKVLMAAAFVVALAMGTSALAQFHGATIAKNTVSPKAPEEYLDVAIQVGYNDDFGDTIRIEQCWDVVDVDGDAVRVPAAGNLEIIAVSGNTTAVVGGPLPVLIGPSGSTLSGLPGLPGDGEVIFGHDDLYQVQPDDPNPLPDQANAIVEDLCDDPETSGCSTGDNQLQFRAATDIECPPPCILITKSVNCDVSKVGDEVIYTICIENCGTFPLDLVEVTDPHLGGILPGFPPLLLPDDPPFCLDFPYTIQPSDAPGPVTNQATVTAIDTCDEEPVTNVSEIVQVDLVTASLTVTKTCQTDPVSEGEPATFEIVITNTGDVDLSITTDEPTLPGPEPLPAGGPPIVHVVVTDPVPPGTIEVCNEITVIATVDDPDAPCLDNVLEPPPAGDCCAVPGEEGCTPGYWKNSPGCWECYGPTTLFSDVFGRVIEVRAGGRNTISNPNLMEALEATGGGINALARHAVAAILNACDGDIDYPMSEAQIIAEVQAAIDAGEDEINSLKDMLDMNNNLGCPQSSDDAYEPCSPEDDEAPV